MNISKTKNCPYKVGGSLKVNDPTYVIRQADIELLESLQNREFCYVLNSRQMGKSSLRVRTQGFLKTNGIKCVAIDLLNLGGTATLEQWYSGLALRMSKELQIQKKTNWRQWWSEHKFLSPVQRFAEFIEEIILQFIDGDIVIFIDEIDTVLRLDFPMEDFFSLIRHYHECRTTNSNYNRLTFCLLGVASPLDLIKDKKRTPFNIGKKIELHGFTFEEAGKTLCLGLSNHIENPQNTLREILYWTGGQPFLTQKLCAIVCKRSREENPDIEKLVQNYIVKDWQSQDDKDHLKTIENRLLNGDKIEDKKRAVKLVNLYKNILNCKQITYSGCIYEVELRLSGIVALDRNYLSVYNPIYKNIFNQKWIEEIFDSLWFFQDISNNVDNEQKNSVIPDKKYLKIIFLIAVSVLAISAFSITLSYTYFSSKIWEDSFGKYGGIIDFSRTVMLTVTFFYVIGFICQKETKEILFARSSNAKTWRRYGIYFFLFIFFLVLDNHIFKAPREFALKIVSRLDKLNYSEYIQCCLRPYLAYLPCSLANFLLLGVPLILVSVYSSIQDFKKNQLRTKNLKMFLTRTEQYCKRFFVKKEYIEKRVNQKFSQYASDFINTLSRYTTLFLGLAVIQTFDARIGATTLSDNGRRLVLSMYLFGFSALVVITWAFSHYQNALQQGSKCLANLQCDYSEFESKNSIFRLVERILSSHLNLSLVFLLIFFNFVENLIKFIAGLF